MKRKKLIKRVVLVFVIVVIGGLSYTAWLFFQPHRDVQATETDYTLQASTIVDEYLKDASRANQKYLDDEGESKVLEIQGNIASISEDFKGNTIILLKSESAKAGVKAFFTKETSKTAKTAQVGSTVTIKGVIRSGAAYDKDLEMYEDVVLEKSKLIKS